MATDIGVAAVAGVFCLLGLGMVMGILILIVEHWFYKYTLPILRLKPKGTIWKSRNVMFFSQVRLIEMWIKTFRVSRRFCFFVEVFC